LPFNDGSALYEAWSSFTDPPGPALAQPGPNGLLVTKFRFQTLAATPPGGTQVTILPSCGPSTVTVVIDGGPSYKPVCCQGPGQGVILDPPATVHVGALAVAEGCRYIRVTPGEGTTLTALRVQGLSTDVTCVDHFVRIDGTLGTSPVFRTGTQWGTIFVRDERIIPSAQYRVATECGASTSSSVVVTTGVWGDVDNNLVLDVDDILLELDCFSGSSTADFEGCNLLSCEAVPGLETIDCDDLLATLDAFSGFGYEVSCPAVCP